MSEQLPSYWQTSILGSSLTTIKVGGPVRYLARPGSEAELAETLEQARKLELPWKMLGAGSNLVMADEGLTGIFIQPVFGQIQRLTPEHPYFKQLYNTPLQSVAARYHPELGEGNLELPNLTGSGETGEEQLVEVGAGVAWGRIVAWSLQQQLGGLHWFARIPCQVGGAVYNNIHGEKHFFSEVVAGVAVYDPVSQSEILLTGEQLGFGYDQSVFQKKPSIITKVFLRLAVCSPAVAAANQAQYLLWNQKKALVQPTAPSSGSVFKNLEPEQVAKSGQNAVAAGWYIDQCGLKGTQVGGMQVYPGQANFIINTGQGSQKDFLQLVEHIRRQVKQHFGFWLQPEVECIDEQGKSLTWI